MYSSLPVGKMKQVWSCVEFNRITCCQAIKQNKVCRILARSTYRGHSRQKEQHMVKAWGREARGLA